MDRCSCKCGLVSHVVAGDVPSRGVTCGWCGLMGTTYEHVRECRKHPEAGIEKLREFASSVVKDLS